jgi:hypothetical protein
MASLTAFLAAASLLTLSLVHAGDVQLPPGETLQIAHLEMPVN